MGSTTLLLPEFRAIATLWFADRAVDLNGLIRANDPLKPFVHLQSAQQINNRGDIVASGIDSRTPFVPMQYFLTLFD